jgi:hypothetical protein
MRFLPRFFFDINDGDNYFRDDEGSELPNEEAARKEALGCLPELTRSKMPDGNRRNFIVDVRDEANHRIFTATLSLVARWVEPRGGRG